MMTANRLPECSKTCRDDRDRFLSNKNERKAWARGGPFLRRHLPFLAVMARSRCMWLLPGRLVEAKMFRNKRPIGHRKRGLQPPFALAAAPRLRAGTAVR